MTRHKYIKGVISLFLTLSIIVLTACTNNLNDSNLKNLSSNKEKSDSSKDNSYSNIKIGVINIGSSTDPSGYTYTHTTSIKYMLSALNMSDDQVIYKDNIPDDNPESIRNAIQKCIDSGCKIIFSTSFGFKDVTLEMANKNPDVYFSHCSGNLSNGKNMNRYFGKIYQPFYLAGIAAGLKTTKNKIGFVSAFGKTVSESAYCLNAFAMGVESVNPKAKVYSYTINCWDDEKKERVASEKLVKLGVDVIGQDTDSSTPQIVAQENDIFSIGYNNDMSKDAPESTLLSVIWNWNQYYTNVVESVVKGTWDASNFFGGFKENTVNISKLADFNHPDAAKKIEEVKNKFKTNSWDVFTGKIVTNTGKTIGKDNESLPDDTIQFETDWLYKNIEEVK